MPFTWDNANYVRSHNSKFFLKIIYPVIISEKNLLD